MAKGKQIYSAEVLYKSQDLLTAVYVQEFFKFCGICTRIRGTDTLEKQQFYWDKVVILNNCIEKTEENMYTVNGQEEEAVRKVAEILGGDVFIKLAKIFNDNKYAKTNYEVHCFLRQMNKQELLESAQSYYECFKELRGLEKEINQRQGKDYTRQHVIYALLTCARKINIICRQRGDLSYFDESKMIPEASKLTTIDQNFFMGDVAFALICFQNSQNWDLGIKEIKHAIEKSDAKKNYTSFFRYLYAHFLEEEMNNKEKARGEYKKILDFHDSYYRALYKQAYYLWKDRERQSAFETFLKMTEQLEQKWKSGWIQPVEIEYLYKGCMFIEHIAEELEKSSGIPAYVFEMISDKNKLFEQSEFIRRFWNNCLRDKAGYFEEKLAKYHV